MAETAETEARGTEVPRQVDDRIRRGREKMVKGAAKRRMYYKFWRGDSYAYVNSRGLLNTQSTISWSAGGQMPDHRIRNSYPFITAIVQAKASAATQRVPGYEVVPSTTEPDDAQAADLAAKVLLYGYDEWRVRRATTKLVEHAFVGGEGFVYPYFDNSLGPFTEDPEAGTIGQGDIRCLVLSANEVYWEPGCDFDDSRWYVIEQARPIDVVKEMPGFIKGDTELIGDATDSESPVEDRPPDLVLVKEYFERPSAKNTEGRKLTIANDRQIVPEEPYPCVNEKGEVLDEPVLLRLSYRVEVDDRDGGLVELLVDLGRTIQDTWNKILEWKNRTLNPQMVAPRGSNMARRDDTPGATWFYTPVGGQKPEWEKAPPVPGELFQILDTAIEHMRAIAADVDVQPEADLAARTAQAAIEESRLRWQSFLGDLADVHSRLGRRMLYLVQRHFTEPRLVKIMGLFGPDLTPGFLGADLLGQADVRVSPDSLAVKSRKQVLEETILYADRQWISPQAAMSAISGGNVEMLDMGYRFDQGRANHVIQTIKRGTEVFFNTFASRRASSIEQATPGDVNDPIVRAQMIEQSWRGANRLPPLGEDEIPGWAPRRFDKVEVHLEVFEAWMKTTEWDRLPSEMQEVASLYYEVLLMFQQREALEAAQQQQMMAEGLGMANAAAPQRAAPTPDQRMPALDNGQG